MNNKGLLQSLRYAATKLLNDLPNEYRTDMTLHQCKGIINKCGGDVSICVVFIDNYKHDQTSQSVFYLTLYVIVICKTFYSVSAVYFFMFLNDECNILFCICATA